MEDSDDDACFHGNMFVDRFGKVCCMFQALKADLQEGRSHGTGLPNIKTVDKRSPSHDVKSGHVSSHVSFSFKKIGARITNTQPFHRRDDRGGQRKSPEIKILRLEPEDSMEKAEGSGEVSSPGSLSEKSDSLEIRPVLTGLGFEGESGREQKLMTMFVKVHSKDDSARMLDWPKEMVQYTVTEPKLMYSCNPLAFDFSQLSKKKSPARADFKPTGEDINKGDEQVNEEANLNVTADDNDGDKDDKAEGKEVEGEKKKSHKKKRKHKKHKKHKTDDKEKVDDEKKRWNS